MFLPAILPEFSSFPPILLQLDTNCRCFYKDSSGGKTLGRPKISQLKHLKSYNINLNFKKKTTQFFITVLENFVIIFCKPSKSQTGEYRYSIIIII